MLRSGGARTLYSGALQWYHRSAARWTNKCCACVCVSHVPIRWSSGVPLQPGSLSRFMWQNARVMQSPSQQLACSTHYDTFCKAVIPRYSGSDEPPAAARHLGRCWKIQPASTAQRWHLPLASGAGLHEALSSCCSLTPQHEQTVSKDTFWHCQTTGMRPHTSPTVPARLSQTPASTLALLLVALLLLFLALELKHRKELAPR